MPSISTNNQSNTSTDSSNPAGPQVVLNTDTEPMTAQNETRAVDQQPAKPTATQEEPTVATPEVKTDTNSGPTIIPNQPAVPEVATTSTTVETETQYQTPEVDNQAVLEKLSQAEANVVKELETAQQEEAGMLDKMKKIIEQTGVIEGKESKLSNRLKELKELREKIAADPTKAEELITEAGLMAKTVTPESTEEVTTETIEEKPKTDPNAPPPQPVGPSARKDESINQPPAISNEQKVLTALQATFSNTNPTIAATLTADAKILRGQDKESLLVKSVENTIQFSKDDLAKAGITGLDLSDIPFAENEPAPAVTETEPPQSETASQTTPVENPPAENQPVAEVTNTDPVEAQTPPALTEPTPEMKTVLQKVQVAPNLSSKHDFLTQATAVYRAADNNGIVVVKGNEQIHIADADLIQAGLTGNDLAGLTPATPPA